ncbi:hypothetical protein [Marinoscillum sp. MHG1-6]|uniref:hypothetical protein n=1 Tax=Marinoscillum sp. MHG1-6 TaxID=2959627 RepID=UPI002157819E|nr:hypothetical protein [Marinoscillum sp. MHG1-6]
MKNIIAIAILSIALGACSSTGEKAEKPLFDQVMDLHDEVMPKMGDLNKAKKALMAKAASAETDSAKQSLEMLANNIELANEAMMDWMRNFDPNFEGTEEEVEEYLTKKKKGIEKVSEMMNNSLAKGQEALN